MLPNSLQSVLKQSARF